ncbi:wall-associated receptor kinase-like 20 [Pyrus ussuriensis x Pyrus communis]|uniref:Wall-associated receptor kinase-like 20 n=1 Tax=Pyrus ussuriensis x Pyrus communis TaxID=2448454 RepID=A0A5N5HVH8_9ROSA|nr:wall-associated receptor kinase-like 20 [Pyrus ussuriensis x Pyrus communis]
MALKSFVFMVVSLVITIKTFHISALGACPKCGNMEVPYPFSTDDTCGDSRVLAFQSAEGFGYKVLSIDLAAQKLIIKPPDLVQDDDMCRTTDFSSEGLRLDENLPFNVSTRNTVILLNCSDNLLRSPLNCSSNSLCRVFEDKMLEGRNNACKSRLCCHYLKDSHMTSHMIRVRVGGCTAYTSVVDIQPQDPADKWNYGIELQWMPPN